MGISIPAKRLALVLERAIALAESDNDLPELWLERTQRMAECPSKTYVAALGTALLAKAADPSVDALSIKAKAGPNAYSMRGVVKTLVEKAPLYGYHLGATGPEPLNNQPWYAGERVDGLANVRRDALPYHRDMVRYLRELNQMGADAALAALAAFLRLRIQFAAEERQRAGRLSVARGGGLADVIDVLRRFLEEDPEDGRRGQALVAALLDLIYPEVTLASINDPTGLDVAVRRDRRTVIGAEVKQKPVTEAAAAHLAEEAAARGVDKAYLVLLAPNQRPLDRESVRREALQEHGVLIRVYEGVWELISDLALQAESSVQDFANRLPGRYLRRMQQHGVSREGQQYWVDLCAPFRSSEPAP
jgi:hypothetical protein